ncbi:YeiH family protein [Phenylobacterium sp. J367]|uniref:YeiH family protein n=1 Tax=Phenylobacterium sp. J367 TaxID=2898435 RepID=UPI00215110A6|nr:YeiH family protein [Phenylobacterium sp. J367]MCR5880862.1 YeiH family protein [Phenylobacterium sp. J367]
MARDIDTDAWAAHEMFQSYGGMEGLPDVAVRPRLSVRDFARRVYPGVLVALTIALAASWLSQHYAAPVMLFALLFGMTFHFLHQEGRCIPGIEFTSKAVLRTGVALLGARITLEQVASLGWVPIGMVVAGVASTVVVGLGLARMLGLSRSFGLLSGGSVGICGASAALAIASALPKTRDTERDTILAVVVVTTLSTIAMVLYPMLVTALGLDHQRAGLFLGGTIHDVAQVVGAGFMISPQTGDVATYVKLLRVAMLLPVVLAVGLIMSRGGAGQAGKAPFPWFLAGFAALVALNSLGVLPKPVTDTASEVSRWCLVAAIAALGMKTSFKALIDAGWRPVAVMVAETVWIGGLVLAVVLLAT